MTSCDCTPACSLAGVYFIGFVSLGYFGYFFGVLRALEAAREREREREREIEKKERERERREEEKK